MTKAEMREAGIAAGIPADVVDKMLDRGLVLFDVPDRKVTLRLVVEEPRGVAEWDCTAYGPESRGFGALCFLSQHQRLCATLDECRAAMTAQRKRVHRRISELAAGGDEVAQYLAAEFPTPETLLNPETGGAS